MENDITSKINEMVDLTLLDPRSNNNDLEKLCNIAYKNKYFSVCVNPSNVKFAKGYISKNLFNEIKVVCVIGFPLGANTKQIKELEVKNAFYDGADEVDVVVNIGEIKNNNYNYILHELKSIKKIAKKRIVKAIIETCYLDHNEMIKVCNICLKAKVDYIKTSTGFGSVGATKENVKFIKDIVGDKCKIKASGGIRSREQAIELISAGADRIGTSHLI